MTTGKPSWRQLRQRLQQGDHLLPPGADRGLERRERNRIVRQEPGSYRFGSVGIGASTNQSHDVCIVAQRRHFSGTGTGSAGARVESDQFHLPAWPDYARVSGGKG